MRSVYLCLVALCAGGSPSGGVGRRMAFDVLEDIEKDPMTLFAHCRELDGLNAEEMGKKFCDIVEGHMMDSDGAVKFTDDEIQSIGLRMEAICSNVWPKPRSEKRLQEWFLDEINEFERNPNGLVCKSIMGIGGILVAGKMEEAFLGMFGPVAGNRLGLSRGLMEDLGDVVIRACKRLR